MNSLSYRTVSANAQTVTKEWILIDAENQTLGRLATRVANVLRGKHKPSFTPHVDCGDNVIIINAEKIVLTGKKMTDKVYVRHTGYPGGQRFATPQQLLNTHPIRVIEHAVRGMLPKNKLAADRLARLRIFDGMEHTHAAQNPKEIK